MWRFRCCPRCKGDLWIEKDFDGWYERCLQCGYEHVMITFPMFKHQNLTSENTDNQMGPSNYLKIPRSRSKINVKETR